jgi:YfiH family protein
MPISNYLPVEWDAPQNIKAFYTDNQCGDFSPKNLTGQANWKNFAETFQLSYPRPWINQVHSNRTVSAPQHYEENADAIITNQTQTPCCVLTADCVPILLCDKKGQWVAAIHAGWRGLVKQILHHCCQKFPNYTEAIAWIGPCICQNHYEVGEETKLAFDALPIDCGAFFQPSNTSAHKAAEEKKFLLNLKGVAQAQLNDLGIQAVFTNNRCTYGDSRLYSYRQNPETGRIANVIWKI